MNIRKITLAALLCAFTTVATMIIHIPTPIMGYIHPGDAFVLLGAFLLNPVLGAFVAGIGSMLADVFTGYIIYAPATFIIKALAAFISGIIYHAGIKETNHFKTPFVRLLMACVAGSIAVTGGYFIYESLLLHEAAALANIPFNLVQNIFGVVIATLLLPLLKKLPAGYYQNA